MRIGIGVDTGGTCTDAVAYDFDAGTLLAKGKSLTTREDLSIGIGKALDALPPGLIRDALFVSLSTTLATNACLEDKGGRAKLLIFGLTDELLERFNAASNYGLRKGYVRCIDTHGSADGLVAGEPDWDEVLAEHEAWLRDADALSASELYSMNSGAPCEKHLKKLSAERFKLPCVCASEFTSELNVLVRGATALLNARMFPIIGEFVGAAIKDFKKRGCKAPVMVVRSDGSMMSSELSRSRPVETIQSGPAASVLAGKSLCDENDYIILDMGGTSTDISIVRGGRPIMADGGIQLAGWQTAVKGVLASPFALGGDSAIRLQDGKLQLSPRRATPMCVAARRWPGIKDMLAELIRSKHVNKFPLHEVLYLVREPAEQKSYESDELALLKLLRDGPCIVDKLQSKAGIDLYHFNGERLEAEGLVMRCGLTPTDFMHIKGDYAEYDAEASILAARYLLMGMGRDDSQESISELADDAYELVEGRMFENILRVMLARQHPAVFREGADEQVGFLIREAWEKRPEKARHNHGSAPQNSPGRKHVQSPVQNPGQLQGQSPGSGSLFSHTFGVNAALVGIGAPTHVFLPEVAKALGAVCILPEHAEVANALGALMADIDVTVQVEISQWLSSNGQTYYIAHTPSGSSRFTSLNEAIAMAEKASAEAAISEARTRGATGEPPVTTRVERHSFTSNEGSNVKLGCAVISEVRIRLG